MTGKYNDLYSKPKICLYKKFIMIYYDKEVTGGNLFVQYI